MAAHNEIKDRRKFLAALKDARTGLRETQYEVGLMYANGIGVAQDFTQALHWIRQAAERGLATAQYLLATRYEQGEAVVQDEHEALKWLLKAVDQDHPKAAYRLAQFYSSTHLQAAMMLHKKAAEQGVAEAAYELASVGHKEQAHAQTQQEAFQWCLRAAEQGIAAAQCTLADRYANGTGVDQDIEQALMWYRKAAKQYHAAAQVALALLDESGLGQRASKLKHHRSAETIERKPDVQLWVDAAQRADVDAHYWLGMMFEHGWSVPCDQAQAQHFYEVAALRHYPPAQVALARLLARDGKNEEALHWFERAAHHGSPEAVCAISQMVELGCAAQMDKTVGVQWSLKAAQFGDVAAMMSLWALFEGGSQVLSQVYLQRAASSGQAQAQYMLGQHLEAQAKSEADMQQVLDCYQQADAQGYVPAQCALGLLYLGGKFIPKNAVLACEWLEKAAHQDDVKAQWNLAQILISGAPEVNKDLKQAFVWCQSAANTGFAPAQSRLGVLYARMRKPKNAAHWWQLAADQGDPEAQYNLALAFAKGHGVVSDLRQSFAWMVRAADQGVVSAQSKVAIMYATGEGVAQDPVEAHKWLLLASQAGDAAAQTNLLKSQNVLSLGQLAESQRRSDMWKQ
jgi:TPR repeat protein